MNSEKLAEHWKNTAEKYEDGVRTSEEHLKELEIEKEKEPEEGVLCIAPPEGTLIVHKVHSQMHP